QRPRTPSPAAPPPPTPPTPRWPRSTRPTTCTRPARTVATWARCSPAKPSPPPSRRPEVSETVVAMTVNGKPRRALVEPRKTLADYLREDCHLTGTHLGCEHGVCGACTVVMDGAAVRSCLVFAVQADGAEVTTIEGIADADGALSPVQAAFQACHGLQCGFCTPGFVVSIHAFLDEHPDPSDEEL